MGRLIVDGLVLLGGALLIASAWLLSPISGLAVAGVACLLLAYTIDPRGAR